MYLQIGVTDLELILTNGVSVQIQTKREYQYLL